MHTTTRVLALPSYHAASIKSECMVGIDKGLTSTERLLLLVGQGLPLMP